MLQPLDSKTSPYTLQSASFTFCHIHIRAFSNSTSFRIQRLRPQLRYKMDDKNALYNSYHNAEITWEDWALKCSQQGTLLHDFVTKRNHCST